MKPNLNAKLHDSGIKVKRIVVILGAPNNDKGELMKIAIDRLNVCINIFNKHTDLIICTGGFGKHFNETPTAHAEYAKRYLINNGINEEYFLDNAISSNTVEDAVKVREIIFNRYKKLTIITSEFHLERTKLIFNEILNAVKKEYIGAKHNFTYDEISPLITHEQAAIEKIKKNGLYY